jgi:hypothetical protein
VRTSASPLARIAAAILVKSPFSQSAWLGLVEAVSVLTDIFFPF